MPSFPRRGRLLAIDLGERRIGLAISDPTQTLAHPLTTLTRRTGKRFPMSRLRTHLETNRTVGVVMGLPLAPNGSEDERAAAAREVGALISEKAGLPVAYWDERMSTARVHATIRELGGSTRGRKAEIDRLAATVILQSFLDSRRS